MGLQRLSLVALTLAAARTGCSFGSLCLAPWLRRACTSLQQLGLGIWVPNSLCALNGGRSVFSASLASACGNFAVLHWLSLLSFRLAAAASCSFLCRFLYLASQQLSRLQAAASTCLWARFGFATAALGLLSGLAATISIGFAAAAFGLSIIGA